jgi:aspartyl-tRNA(Asn)/glutamyl-tRNA(Gln) amidotransferase subunit C
MASITKKELAHLAELARIELTPHEEDKLIKDLGNILGYFEELNAIPAEEIAAAGKTATGNAEIKNAFREDTERVGTNQGKGIESFPDKVGSSLKIPPVFE